MYFITSLENPLDPRLQIYLQPRVTATHSTHASRSIFSLVWPWPLTCWPLNLIVLFRCPCGRLVPIGIKIT